MGVTVAGGRGRGSASNQLHSPRSLFIDDDQTMVIADTGNHRIVQWKCGDIYGQVVAGGKDKGDRLDQLNHPTSVVIDKVIDGLIICDSQNRRVVQWYRHNGTTQGEILIGNISCEGLTIDDQGGLYVSSGEEKQEVRRYGREDNIGTIVAGGHGPGTGLNQCDNPFFIFVDQQQNVYVADNRGHRIMKWSKGAKEGIVVAGGHGRGNGSTQFDHPNGLFVDKKGTLYVADDLNSRVMCWPQGAQQGTVVAGENGWGEAANQFRGAAGLSFDRQGQLYVVDERNDRVQRFSIK